MSQRDTPATLRWYREHRTTATIGFNPDGMCQKIVRTARNIGPGAPSALAAAHATPREERVYDLTKVVNGMVGYFDHPDDDNPSGHVVTWVGRDKTRDPHTLGSLFCETNSVQAGRLTVVRGDYFDRMWNDPYQFSGTSINGVPLDLPDRKPKARPPGIPAGRVRRLEGWIDVLDRLIEEAREDNRPRLVRAFRRDRKHLRETIDRFGPDQ